MIQANIHEAKTQLSKLIERAEAGEEVVIARKGKPIVRLQLVQASAPKRSWIGMFEGKMAHVPSDEEWRRSDLELALSFGPDCYDDDTWKDMQREWRQMQAG